MAKPTIPRPSHALTNNNHAHPAPPDTPTVIAAQKSGYCTTDTANSDGTRLLTVRAHRSSCSNNAGICVSGTVVDGTVSASATENPRSRTSRPSTASSAR